MSAERSKEISIEYAIVLSYKLLMDVLCGPQGVLKISMRLVELLRLNVDIPSISVNLECTILRKIYLEFPISLIKSQALEISICRYYFWKQLIVRDIWNDVFCGYAVAIVRTWQIVFNLLQNFVWLLCNIQNYLKWRRNQHAKSFLTNT